VSVASLSLLESRAGSDRTGGVLTPATGLAEPYLERLSSHGMSFTAERVS